MLQLFDRFAEREVAREQQVRAESRAKIDRREREARDTARALAAAELRTAVLQLQLQAAHANGPSVSPPPLTNPLGSCAGVHKLGVVYACLKCFSPRFNAQLKYIFLALLLHSDDRSVFGSDAIFQSLVEEIKIFATDWHPRNDCGS